MMKSPQLAGTPVAVVPSLLLPAVPILGPQLRRVREVSEGERGKLADRLDPEVSGPFKRPLPLAGTSWECALNPFLTMSTVPGPVQVNWDRIMAIFFRDVLNAKDKPSLTMAFSWFLTTPQATTGAPLPSA